MTGEEDDERDAEGDDVDGAAPRTGKAAVSGRTRISGRLCRASQALHDPTAEASCESLGNIQGNLPLTPKRMMSAPWLAKVNASSDKLEIQDKSRDCKRRPRFEHVL